MSLTDWQYQSIATVALDEAVFHSAPSSLKLTGKTAPANALGYCVLPACAVLHSGRIEFYSRQTSSQEAYPIVVFRVGTQYEIDYTCPFFRLTIGYSDASLWWHDSEGATLIDEWEVDIAEDAWHHLRVTWWVNSGHLCFSLEEESAGEWSYVIPPYDTLVNYGAADPLARCGIGVRTPNYVDKYCHFDDVKIFKIASPA